MNHANQSFDVLIVGGGAVGCAIARELARYRLSIALVEKEADVAAGTSGRNSAVVHAGFNNRPGSLMAKLCVAGNQGFPRPVPGAGRALSENRKNLGGL